IEGFWPLLKRAVIGTLGKIPVMSRFAPIPAVQANGTVSPGGSFVDAAANGWFGWNAPAPPRRVEVGFNQRAA
ncbi:MAG TPA: hypothetical protein VK726_10245, partial [Acetobacteraceae bacterium]|nr:hypothetical protein [Acetobacteraceae bacterium]